MVKGKPRVVVVEDDDAIREMLCIVLNEAGFDIVASLDGEHALRTSLAHRPKVILLDLGLPLLDGSGFLDRWRERDPSAREVPVIVMSAQPNGAEIADRIGAVAFLAKPLDAALVVATIRAHLR